MSIFALCNRTSLVFLCHMSQDNIGIVVDGSEVTRYIRIFSETNESDHSGLGISISKNRPYRTIHNRADWRVHQRRPALRRFGTTSGTAVSESRYGMDDGYINTADFELPSFVVYINNQISMRLLVSASAEMIWDHIPIGKNLPKGIR